MCTDGTCIVEGRDSSKMIPVVDLSAQMARVQELRLCAALIESGWAVMANSDQVSALESADRGYVVNPASDDTRYVNQIETEIDHAAPRTRFGHVERFLIFPTWLGGIGRSARQFRVSFQGLPTRSRVNAMITFVESSGLAKGRLSRLQWLGLRFRKVGSSASERLTRLFDSWVGDSDVRIKWSDGGRNVSNKLVDPDYWETMTNSKMVYCPAGDFGWTYRFYESMLAGAVPLIDVRECDDYHKGFIYLEQPSGWDDLPDKESVLHENRSKVIRLLTAVDDLHPQNFPGVRV